MPASYGATNDSSGAMSGIASAAGIDVSNGLFGGVEAKMQSMAGMDHHSVSDLLQEFKDMDTDGSHTVTREEWAAKHHGDMTEFDKYDIDGDGVIDETEELKIRMEELCAEHEELAVFADELHNTPATAKELRKIFNLFLEPLRVTCAELYYFHTMDKVLSLSIMILGTIVPMLHMMGFDPKQCAMVGAAIPLMQGLNLKFQPHKKMVELERVKSAVMTEGHHFFSLTGEYHEHADHSEAHREFLENVESARGKKPKGKKKKKQKDEDGDGLDDETGLPMEVDEDNKGGKKDDQMHKGGPVQKAVAKSSLEVRLGDDDKVHALPLGNGFKTLDDFLDEAESVLGVEILSAFYDDSDDQDEITKDKEVKNLTNGERIRFTFKEKKKRGAKKN